MGIVERILQIPNYYNLNVSEFSKIVGVSNGYFAKQKTNDASVGSKILEKIVKTYPEINTSWLLTGEGGIFKTKTPKILIKENDKENDKDFDKERKLQKSLSNDEEDFEGLQEARPVVYDMPEGVVENAVAVPVLPVEAAAGAGAFNLDFNEEVETMVLPRSFLTPTTSMRYCIDVRGESMEPTLLDRTRIVIRLLDRSNWGDVRNGKVYVITDREGLTYVKRVQNRLKTRGALVLISDNPDRDRFRSFELREEEIQHIWTVELYIADHIPPVAQRWDGLRDELDALRDRLDEMELMMK